MRLDQRKEKLRRLRRRAKRIVDQAKDEDRTLSDTERRIADGLIEEARDLYLSIVGPSERRTFKRKWNALEEDR